MKAPDKITISKYNIADDGDVVFAWVDNSPECEPMNHPVEYVRADAFIKKIENYLNFHLYGWISVTNPYQRSYPYIIPKKDFIDDLKNYMKGK